MKIAMGLFKGKKQIGEYAMIDDLSKDNDTLAKIGDIQKLKESVRGFIVDYCFNDKKKLNLGNGYSLKEIIKI